MKLCNERTVGQNSKCNCDNCETYRKEVDESIELKTANDVANENEQNLDKCYEDVWW